MMRTLFTVLYTVCACILAVIAGIILSNRSIPSGNVGPEAEALTDSIMVHCACTRWNATRFLKWRHNSGRAYVWDRYYNLAEVHTGDLRILINLNTLDGIVWKDGIRLDVHAKRKHLDRTWEHWKRDFFWVHPVCSLRNGGVVKRLIIDKKGTKHLLATYTRGVYLGENYLWTVSEDYMPVSWRMWNDKYPVRGLKAIWEQWAEIRDIPIATTHGIGPWNIVLSDIRLGMHYSELGLARDPFVDFVTQ